MSEDKGAGIDDARARKIAGSGSGDANFHEFCELVDRHVGDHHGYEDSRSIMLCGRSWIAADVNRFERRFRIVAPGVFVAFNCLWFPIVLIKDRTIGIVLGVLLSLICMLVWLGVFCWWNSRHRRVVDKAARKQRGTTSQEKGVLYDDAEVTKSPVENLDNGTASDADMPGPR